MTHRLESIHTVYSWYEIGQILELLRKYAKVGIEMEPVDSEIDVSSSVLFIMKKTFLFKLLGSEMSLLVQTLKTQRCHHVAVNFSSHLFNHNFIRQSARGKRVTMASSKTLSQLRLLWTHRLRVRPRVRMQLSTHLQYRYQQQCSQQQPLGLSCAALRRRCFMSASSSSDFEPFQRALADEKDEKADRGNSNRSGSASTFPMSKREGDAFAVDTLPALKVLSETFALVKKSPAFQNWSSTDWLLGLTGMRSCIDSELYDERRGLNYRICMQCWRNTTRSSARSATCSASCRTTPTERH